MHWWPEPAAGDIVWCHFPDNINPRPKPRPALILNVFDDDAPHFVVDVAYGTSQKTTTLYAGEFGIYSARNPVAYKTAGLSYDTKFNLKNTFRLEYSSKSFSVPPGSFTQDPKLGVLHPSLMHALKAAYDAVSK